MEATKNIFRCSWLLIAVIDLRALDIYIKDWKMYFETLVKP